MYPEWWKGDSTSQSPHGQVVSLTKQLGTLYKQNYWVPPDDPEAFGSGAIPKETIIKTERKPGVPNAKSVALIRHISGGELHCLQMVTVVNVC